MHPGESAWLPARSAGYRKCPGSNPVKPSAGLDEAVSGAKDGGCADATEHQNTPIAKTAKIGPI